MNSLDRIMLVSNAIAERKGIKSLKKIEVVKPDSEVVEAFVNKVVTDLFEFDTLEQFDSKYDNLFGRAFIYMFGKGAEYAFCWRTGEPIGRIAYSFHDCMQAKCADQLPEDIRTVLYKQMSGMLDMYVAMFEVTKGSQEENIADGISFHDMMFKTLSGAFFWGKELIETIELNEAHFEHEVSEKEDEPYDYDNYSNDYVLDHFKIVKFRVGEFDDIKHLFK
jgi:hypothetical protein